MNKNSSKTTKVLVAVLAVLILVLVVVALIALSLDISDKTAAQRKKTSQTQTPDDTSMPGESPDVTPEVTKDPESGDDATPTPTPTPTPVPSGDLKAVGTVSFLAAGDNLFHNGLLKEAQDKAAERGMGEDFYFDYLYENVKGEVSAADISVINQESLLLPKNYLSNNISRYIRNDGCYVCPGEVADALIRTGFNVMDKANNHMLDLSSGGMKWSNDFTRSLKDRGMESVGSYYSKEDSEKYLVIEKNGVKIAILAYTYGTEVPQSIATRDDPDMPYYVPLTEDDKMISDLQNVKNISDFTVVLVHWGNELQETPSDEQRRVAKVLAENGAGIIVGHHSHCLQPIEYVDNGRGGKVVCAYSIGTFVSNMSAENNMLAGLFKCVFTKWNDGSVTVSDVRLVPTVFYYDMEYRNSRLMYLADMTDSLCASHGIGNYPKNSDVKNKMTRATLYAYLQKTIGNEFLPDEYKK